MRCVGGVWAVRVRRVRAEEGEENVWDLLLATCYLLLTTYYSLLTTY